MDEVEARKKTAKKTKENSKVAFPIEGFVNQWGFIHLGNGVAKAFGATKGQKTAITIDLQERRSNHKEGLNVVFNSHSAKPIFLLTRLPRSSYLYMFKSVVVYRISHK